VGDLTDVREAVRLKMTGDSTLTGLLGTGARIFNLKARRPETIPSIVYSDSGSRPDAIVPLHERVFSMEVWGRTVEEAEIVAARLRFLFHGKSLTIAGGAWNFAGMYALADDYGPVEDGDVIMLPLQFRMLVYELT